MAAPMTTAIKLFHATLLMKHISLDEKVTSDALLGVGNGDKRETQAGCIVY